VSSAKRQAPPPCFALPLGHAERSEASLTSFGTALRGGDPSLRSGWQRKGLGMLPFLSSRGTRVPRDLRACAEGSLASLGVTKKGARDHQEMGLGWQGGVRALAYVREGKKTLASNRLPIQKLRWTLLGI